MSILTPWKITGNSEGLGALNSQNLKIKEWSLTGISGLGEMQTEINFHGRDMDIFWKNTFTIKLGSLLKIIQIHGFHSC